MVASQKWPAILQKPPKLSQKFVHLWDKGYLNHRVGTWISRNIYLDLASQKDAGLLLFLPQSKF